MMQQRGAADLFARAVTRQAVAQAALAVGCKHAYSSVLDALTDLVQDFVQTVGLASQAKANAGGRTLVSTLDVVAALEEPPQLEGRDRYELDWRALRGFAFRDVTQPDRPEAFQWYQPFHTHIPPFPVPAGVVGRKRAWADEAGEAGEADEGEGEDEGAQPQRRRQRRRPVYVPSFLPAFPPEHTFRKTGIKATAKTEDPAAIQQHRIATKQLILKAMQRATAGSAVPAAAAAPSSASAATTVRRGRSAGPVDEEDEEDAGSVVSLPEAAVAALPVHANGRGKKGAAARRGGGGGTSGTAAMEEDDEDLFKADAQPFRPVGAAGAGKPASPAKPGAAIGGTRS